MIITESAHPGVKEVFQLPRVRDHPPDTWIRSEGNRSRVLDAELEYRRVRGEERPQVPVGPGWIDQKRLEQRDEPNGQLAELLEGGFSRDSEYHLEQSANEPRYCFSQSRGSERRRNYTRSRNSSRTRGKNRLSTSLSRLGTTTFSDGGEKARLRKEKQRAKGDKPERECAVM